MGFRVDLAIGECECDSRRMFMRMWEVYVFCFRGVLENEAVNSIAQLRRKVEEMACVSLQSGRRRGRARSRDGRLLQPIHDIAVRSHRNAHIGWGDLL